MTTSAPTPRAWGLTAEDFAQAAITDQYTDADTGMTHIYLRQQYRGLEVFGADLAINIDAMGCVMNVGGGFVPGLAGAAGALLTIADTEPQLSSVEAFQSLVEGLGLNAGGADAMSALGDETGTVVVDSATLADSRYSLDPIPVKLLYVPTEEGVVLAWDYILRTPDGLHWYEACADASSGDLTVVSDWVDTASYNVFAMPVEAPNDGSRSTATDPQLAAAAPYGWHDTNGSAGAEYTDTRGNNVFAQEDTDANNSGGFRPDGTASLTFDFPLDLTQAPSVYQSAAITNLFYWNNICHDFHNVYGFTEAAGNFQVLNYGGQGLGNDAVQADAQDGSGTNNANFATPPDGSSPRMQMFKFTLTSPQRDGDLDAEIIVHEYGHGVSNRLVGGPSNVNALNAVQSGGMGEGWSDWWGLMFTQKSTDTQAGSYPVGTYVLGQSTSGAGIRRYPYSYNMSVDPLTYGNIRVSSEVHDTGEIWCSTLWDLNWLLINKYGFNPDLSAGYSAGCAGNLLALKLVTDSLKLMPANPSFLQGRDALLLADRNLTGGANQGEIWAAFARRGMSFSAYDGGSGNSTNVTEAFDLPNFRVTAQSPSGTVAATPTFMDFTFSRNVLQSSFSIADDVVSFTGPGGTDLLAQVTGYSFTAANTLRISFNPQAAQGQYSLVIGPHISSSDGMGEMDQNSNGTAGESVADRYTAALRYDAVAMQVASTLPAAGGVLSIGDSPAHLQVAFNEAYDPASIGANDLTLSAGSVSGFRLIDTTTVEYDISGIAAEQTLNVTMAAGAATDVYGNSSLAFNGSYQTDVGTVNFPVPLTAKSPLGSLIYSGTANGMISAADDLDGFVIHLDTGQTVSVSATPGSSWQPTVSLTDPAANVVAATASAEGKKAVIQTVPAAVAGDYVLTVGAATGTGQYTLQITLNAALEAEANDGPANDTQATAQDLDGTFTGLADGTAQRGAAAGTLPADAGGTAVYSESFESGPPLGALWSTYSSPANGWIQVSNARAAADGSYALLMDSSASSTYALNEAIWTVNLADVPSPTLTFYHANWADTNTSFNGDFTGHYIADGVAISADGVTWHPVWNGVSQTSGAWLQYSIDLAAQCATHGIALGNSFKIKFQQYDNNSIPTDGRGYDQIVIATPTPAVDWYKFSLAAGETAALGLSAASGSATLQLFDAGEALLTAGTATSNLTQHIAGYTAAAAGTYYVRLAGNAGDYRLVVTKNAGVDAEPNNSIATAQNISPSMTALGYLETGTAGADYYLVHLDAGQGVKFHTNTPGDGNGEFVNVLDPKIELFDNAGTLLAEDDNTAPDGRNALLTYVAASAGDYIVRISSSAGTGEYVLAIDSSLLSLTLPSDAREGDAAVTGTVSIPAAMDADQIIHLASSDTGRATVPESVTIPAHQTSADFLVEIVDNALLDGLQSINIAASSDTHGTSIGTITIHDNETAVLTVSLPASAVEGAGVLTGAGLITADAAPSRDIVVYLSSDDTSEITVPAAVLLRAGETTAAFDVTVIDDSLIDDAQTATVTATVENWTSGTASMSVADDDRTLAVEFTLPIGAWEGDSVSDAGTVRIGGALSTDLVVHLTSGDESALLLPATVTILAGETSAKFSAQFVDNTLRDGAKTTAVTAGASGFIDATEALLIHDNDVNQFVFEAIGTQAAGVAFQATARAKNIDDETILSYSDAIAALSSTGQNGPLPVTPDSIGFTAGVWTGNVTVNGVDPAVVLQLDDGLGTATVCNAFAVTSGPLAGFQWSTIDSPQGQSVPFAATLTAQDANGYTVTDFNGTANLYGQTSQNTVTVGTGTSTWSYLLRTSYNDSRTQVIYHASEIGGAGLISSLAIDVTTVPGQMMNDWTIRIKPTTLSSYSTKAWESSGWTTVYQADQTISATGWTTFVFDTPFAFDGASNLMVDFSFNNSTNSTRGYVRCTSFGQTRSIYYYTNSDTYGDPLTWSGTTPPAKSSSSIPNVRFTVGEQVPIEPTVANFVDGVWTGNIAVLQAAANMYLWAVDNANHQGASNLFNVVDVPAPDLTVTKTHSGNFRVGDVGDTYTITVANIGTLPTDGAVNLADLLPAGLTATAFYGDGWTTDLATLTATRSDTLAVGASYPVLTLVVDVAADAPAGVVNTATVSGGGDIVTINNTASDSTTIIQAADLTVTKTHSGNFRQGDVGDTYTIIVKNSGLGPTVGAVSLADLLPAGLTATAFSGAGWTTDLAALTATRSDVLAAGASYAALTLTVSVAADAPAGVINTATVSGGGELNTANNTADDSTIIVPVADLAVAKEHSGNFKQGDVGNSYTITVSNVGQGATVGTVSLTDLLPAGLTATAFYGDGWTTDLAALTATRSDILAAGASYPLLTLVVDVSVDAPASLTNTATVSGGGETNTGNNTAGDPTIIVQAADLTVTKSHVGNFVQGGMGVYSIVVSNVGPGATVGMVSLTDLLPAGLTATAFSGAGWTTDLSTLTATRSDVLAAGASYAALTLTVSVAADAPAGVVNTATVSGGGELNTANNQTDDNTVILPPPDLTVTKTHSGNFTQGGTGVYSIVVSNVGLGATVGTVSLTDLLPAGLTATAINGAGWTTNLSTLTATRSDALTAGASYSTLTLTVSVAVDAPAAVVNTATVSGGGELNTSNNTANDPTTIVIVPPAVTSTTPTLNGGTLNGGTTTLAIDFSEAVVGANLAANYQLQSLGPDALLGTADDAIVPLTVSYSGTRATLGFSGLSENVYRLTVRDAIAESTGARLDGDADGLPGGDFVRDFVVLSSGIGLSFSSPVVVLTGSSASRVIIPGDFNRDGNVDLAVVSQGNDVLYVTLGDGTGGFSTPISYATGGNTPLSAAAADFNGDGITDIAVGNHDSNNVGVLLGNGNGGFSAATTFLTGGDNPSSVLATDLNNDNHVDLIVANYGSATVAVLLGNGTGGFLAPTTFSAGSRDAYKMAIGDFNGDGKTDLVVDSLNSSTISILIGDGTGSFSAPSTFSAGGSNPNCIAAADLNYDGKLDFVVTANSGMIVFSGNGLGGFLQSATLSTGGSLSGDPIIRDINGDGILDIAVRNWGSHNVGLLLGNGTGNFSAPTTYPATTGATGCLATEDVNRDGKLDFVVGDFDYGNIAVLSNCTEPSITTLYSPQGFAFDIDTAYFGAGQLVQGTNNAFDGLNRLQVGGTNYAPTSGAYSTSDGGRTLTLAAQTLSGLNVSREITVPNTGSEDFARTIEILQNTTDSDIATTVRIVGNLGSDAATHVFATSDGDDIPEPTDWWIGTDDADGSGSPAVIHFIHGPAGLQPASVVITGDNVEWTYNVTVSAGQTARLANFTIVNASRAGAIAAANALVSAAGFGGQAAAFLDAAELASLANFQFVPCATVSLDNPAPETNDVLTATAAKSGYYGDPISLTFVWRVNGVVKRTFTSTTELADHFDLETPGNGDAGDTITVSVTPSQGDLVGETAVDTAIVAPGAPPKVVGVYVSGSAWRTAYFDVLAAAGAGNASLGYRLPDGPGQLTRANVVNSVNVNMASFVFNEPVYGITESSLTLVDSSNNGGAASGITITGLSRPNACTATFTFSGALTSNKYYLALDAAGIVDEENVELDGEWITSTSTYAVGSGDGSPGGNFNFRFNVLAGDVNGDGKNNGADFNVLRNILGFTDATNWRYDINGDGKINGGDHNASRSWSGVALADFPEPNAPPSGYYLSRVMFIMPADETPDVLAASPAPYADQLPSPDGIVPAGKDNTDGLSAPDASPAVPESGNNAAAPAPLDDPPAVSTSPAAEQGASNPASDPLDVCSGLPPAATETPAADAVQPSSAETARQASSIPEERDPVASVLLNVPADAAVSIMIDREAIALGKTDKNFAAYVVTDHATLDKPLLPSVAGAALSSYDNKTAVRDVLFGEIGQWPRTPIIEADLFRNMALPGKEAIRSSAAVASSPREANKNVFRQIADGLSLLPERGCKGSDPTDLGDLAEALLQTTSLKSLLQAMK